MVDSNSVIVKNCITLSISGSLGRFVSELTAPSRIAIIVSDVKLSNIISEALVDYNFNVAVYTRGLEAIPHIQNEHFSMIFLEDSLPDISSLEVIKKANSVCPKVPVVLLSSDTDFVSEACVLGPVSLMSKPILEKSQISRLLQMFQLVPDTLMVPEFARAAF